MKTKTGTRQVIQNPNNDIAISVTKLYKSFKLPTERAYGVKQAIFNRIIGIKGYKKQNVLNGIDLEIKKGEFVGIVGRNGSGKSTLLKILAGIYYPEKGNITINGSLIPFIELGVGFNPELTGRENVYLNGALLGFSNKEIDEMYDEIVEFAELEDFMDQKLKNFSSGMQVRLAFSIAIKAEGDILVLDEVLAVGDEAFQVKCNQFFNKIKKDKSKTVILVSHSMASVRQFCSRAILIRNGRVEIDGTPEDVANSYSLENAQNFRSSTSDIPESKSIIKDLKINLLSSDQVTQKDSIKLDISYSVQENVDTFVAVTLWDIMRGQPLLNSNSKSHLCSGSGQKSLIFSTNLTELNDANIRVYVSIKNSVDETLVFAPDENSPTLILRRSDYPDANNKTTNAVLFNRGSFKINKD